VKVTLFVGSDDYEKLCCALDAGNVAAAMGADVTMYFATRGLKAIMKDGTKNIPRLEGGPSVEDKLNMQRNLRLRYAPASWPPKSTKLNRLT